MDESRHLLSAPAGTFLRMNSREMSHHSGVKYNLAPLENEAFRPHFIGSTNTGSTFVGQSSALPGSLHQTVSGVVMTSSHTAKLNSCVAPTILSGSAGQKQLPAEVVCSERTVSSQTTAVQCADTWSSSASFTTERVPTDNMLSASSLTCSAVSQQTSSTAAVNVACARPVSSSFVQRAAEVADDKVSLRSEVNSVSGLASPVKNSLVLNRQLDVVDNSVDPVTVSSVKVEPEIAMEANSSDLSESVECQPAVTSVKLEVKTEQLKHEIKSEVAGEKTVDSKDHQLMKHSDAAGDDEPAGDADVKKLSSRKVWSREELIKAFMPIWQKIYFQEPEGILFRLPVDPVALCVPDYFNIIKNPMDLSLMKTKLDEGLYNDPWEFVDDMWLMFNNAWLYNRKTSKVYKFCTKLAELFEADIDGAMQSLGHCCGRKYVFSPQVLCCFGKGLCPIPRDTVYYVYDNRFIYCEKCFNEVLEDDIELTDDPMQPALRVKKEHFVKEKNDKLEFEQFVVCNDCGRKLHQICVQYMSEIWPDEFVCDICLSEKNDKRKENKFTAKRLPTTKLSCYLENRVNDMLKLNKSGAGEVIIRVLSSYDKTLDLKPAMKAKFGDTGKMASTFPYRAKTIFAFEEIDGCEVCFFGMHVQEYGSDCPPPNSRRVYIAYLDSVHFFRPRQFRTEVYHDILIGYLDFAKSIGYAWAHIWACPPCEGDDYIFHCHPQEQKIPKPKRLQDWYRKMLDKAQLEKVIFDYKDIMKDAVDNGIKSVTQMPYFEGDFWPNVLEDCAKALDGDVEQPSQESSIDGDTEDSSCSSISSSEPLGKTANGKKKGQKSGGSKKKNSKTKNHSLRRGSKSGLGNSDLSAKLFTTMEKHKEVFFVVRLHTPSKVADLPPVNDPDALIANDLMDGRDAFLMMARDRHYEFSSLRRAKFSSMAMLYELHTQARDSFVYTCNSCHANVDTRYHCSVCDDFDLCVPCYDKLGHPHKMDRLGFDLEDGTGSVSGPSSVAAGGDELSEQKPAAVTAQEARRRSIQTCLQSLVHACHCRDANCRLIACQKMKRLIQHSSACRRKNAGGCPVCKQLIALCCYHAKSCDVPKCPVPYCCAIKEKLERQRAEQRLKQAQLMRRRMAAMQRGMMMEAGVPAETVPLTSSVVAQPANLRDKNAQFVGMGQIMPPRNVESPAYSGPYHRTVQSPFGAGVSQSSMYDRRPQYAAGVISSSCGSQLTVIRPAAGKHLGNKGLEMMTATTELSSGIHRECSEAMTLQRHATMTNTKPASSLYGPTQHPTSVAALMQSGAYVGVTSSSLHVAAAVSSALIPVYNTSTQPPRMQMMCAAGGPQLSANILRPRERCERLYDAGNASDVQAARMWQQNSQFTPRQQSSRLQMQPMPAYMMTQQPRVQAPVSGCGTVPDWPRFSGHLPYQQSERLPQHQQRHMLPAGAVMRQQLPTYQNAVDQHLRQEMMLKHNWQQQHQQQRHLMHFQPASRQHSSVAAAMNEACGDVAGFRHAASDVCMMSATSSYAVPASAVSSGSV